MTKKEFGKYGRIYHGNCMEILPQFKDNIFTSCVTDPPYELGFMQQEWDKSGIAYSKEFWKLLLSKLNHGAHVKSSTINLELPKVVVELHHMKSNRNPP